MTHWTKLVVFVHSLHLQKCFRKLHELIYFVLPIICFSFLHQTVRQRRCGAAFKKAVQTWVLSKSNHIHRKRCKTLTPEWFKPLDIIIIIIITWMLIASLTVFGQKPWLWRVINWVYFFLLVPFHQVQKNNLLPCLAGSRLPSMVGLGSGRGLEW